MIKKNALKIGNQTENIIYEEQSNITDALYFHRAQRITQCESASQNGQELHAGFIHHRIKSRCSGSFFKLFANTQQISAEDVYVSKSSEYCHQRSGHKRARRDNNDFQYLQEKQ